MFGGSKQSRLRKALGAIKDTTTVSLAKFHSEYKELDIAIVKATDHYERPAKEKYIKAIFAAVSATRPRADVAYFIYALARRLSRTRNWVVALKTLIVIHRALREVDPTFHEEFINHGRSRRHMLNLSHFKDDSNLKTWDYSAWVRSYALYLEDRLECFRILKYDIEMIGPRTKGLDTAEALEHLTALQQLLFHVLGCQPIGAAAHNLVIRFALSLVALESVNIYRALSDGTINLMDKFFGMDRPDAMRALNIYRRSRYQVEGLSEFYEVCKRLDIGHGDMYVKIEQPPASFLQEMEDYVNEAPQASTVRKDQQIENPKEVLAVECKKAPEVQQCSSPSLPEPLDLLGLNNPATVASKLDEKNALELAIVPVAEQTTSPAASVQANGTTGRELALITAPISNDNATATYKMGGGFDKFMLDSLYEDTLIQRSYQKVGYNPWEPPPTCNVMMHDSFYGSNTVAVSPSVQMSTAASQHQAFMLQQPMMGPQQPPSNAFGYPYGANVHPYYSGIPVQPYSGLI
ncbi:putative clathrin assembly protein At5g35200 [Hibiscus syriacus]|uniref:putative clathrin assembly protein At5g35200 n=1 Tax=Hibiscus syriacus TaxID=106335 RepID=UPI001923FFBC|nr:putative clathrin assembly protein At5g35200 [Hibiscus syriacus]